MKKYLILAASALLLAACSEKPGYEINGTVANTDLNGKYVYLYEYGVQDAAPMDSALVQTVRSRSREHRTPPPYASLPSPRMSWNPNVPLPARTPLSQAYSYWRTVNYRLFLMRQLPPFLEHRRMTD